MKEDCVRREYYWYVEAVDKSGKVVYRGTFNSNDFDSAWTKYYSFKDKNTVMLQRRYKEFKVA